MKELKSPKRKFVLVKEKRKCIMEKHSCINQGNVKAIGFSKEMQTTILPTSVFII
jgi:hypothetical protein